MSYYKESILIVAAHPDDEVLGCGGSIAKFAKAGCDVHVVFLADGVGSRHQMPADKTIHDELVRRRGAAHAALTHLGVSSVDFGDFPDNRMDSLHELDVTKFVEKYVATYRPDTIFTHHAGDLNVDHRRVHQAVITACRPQPGHPVRTILFFEIPSSTEWQTPGSSVPFLPNWFVDISSVFELKQLALRSYATEMRAWPHTRSYEAVEHLARWRGATVGVEAAEAFMLGRAVIHDRDILPVEAPRD